MTGEAYVAQAEERCERLKLVSIRSVARNHNVEVRNLRCRLEQVLDALLCREAPKVQRCSSRDWGLGTCRRFLEMGQYCNAICSPSVLNQFVFDELAWSQEQIDTLVVGAEPAVYIGFRRQHNRLCRSARIASLVHRI